jgi:hypothetical protein
MFWQAGVHKIDCFARLQTHTAGININRQLLPVRFG